MPHERAMPRESQDEQLDDPLSSPGSEPLVPILRVDAGQIDSVALATWHQALSNTVSVEVPHDLMGLWLYPSQGGAALVGPAELAADDLPVPIPAPHLRPEELAAVEKVVLDAGYRSASCLPISFGKRDVALLLVADLQPGRYGPAERVLLQCVARRVAPMLGRIARQWVPVEASSSRQQERIAGLLETVAQANRDTSAPQSFLAGVSRGLAPLMPHDHIELLVPNAAGDLYFRLGEHAGGPLWADPSLAISRQHLDIAGIFDPRTDLLVSDTYEDERWPRGFLTASEPAGADIRAVVGARLSFGRGAVAYLLVGSIGPEIYGEDDVGLIAPQVGGFIRTTEPQQQPETLSRIAGLLATTSDPAAATRLIAAEGARLLPLARLTIALRVAEEDRIILVEPGEQRALGRLPQMSMGATTLGRVIRGEAPHSLLHSKSESRLIVPLRAAGKVHGALVFRAPQNALAESHIDPAQRLADIAAADLELLRLSSMLPAPKRQPERPTETTGRKLLRAMPATPPVRTEPGVRY
jgi:hypothetical protein